MDDRKPPVEPRPLEEAALLQAAIRVLEKYDIPAEADLAPAKATTAKVCPDAVLRLQLGGRRQTFLVETKRWLTPATLGHAVAQLRHFGKNALLVTDYVTPPVAEKLKELGVEFIDAAGNAYLRRPPAFVWVVGRKPEAAARPRRAGRAFRPTGLQLLFALLCRPDIVKAPLRELAVFAGVAHGTAGTVLTELRELGYLVEHGTQRTRTRKLRNREKLLAQWVEAYARTLRPQLLIGRYRATEPDWWKRLDAAKYKALLGGEPAAAIATGFLKPGIVTVYLQDTPGRLLADYRLRKDVDGEVELRRRFWPFEHEWRHPNLAPPVLVYADLLATGDARCLETARRLHDKYLARPLADD